jgi:serine protease inhibitor
VTMQPKRNICRAAWLLATPFILLAGGAAPGAAAERGSSTGITADQTAPAPDRLMAAQSALALRLVNTIATKQAGGNVVVSPASLAAALSVIEPGVSPQLRPALYRVLGFNKSPTAWTDFERLRRITNSARENSPLSSANAIFFDAATKAYPEAVAALSREGVRTETSDFRNPETLATINDWVKQQTKGKIPTILDELPKDTGLVALNAVYFKDRWKQAFSAEQTRPGPFNLVGGMTVDVPLMHASDRKFSFRRDAHFIAVDLPYATPGFSLVVVTTNGAPAAAKEFAGVGDWLSGRGFSEAPGEIALPRFGASTNIDLMPTLVTLGFQPPMTLPGFAPGPLRIAKAQQRVELKVDEEGSEAAAATGVAATRSIENDFVKLTIDKPYVFALRDSTTGLIVVAGYVARPDAPQADAKDKPVSN